MDYPPTAVWIQAQRVRKTSVHGLTHDKPYDRTARPVKQVTTLEQSLSMSASRHATDRAKDSSRALEESALLQKVFVDDGGWFGRKLSPFLQQTLDVFPDQI